MDHFFSPKSIAVIGASTKAGKVGHSIVRNILEYGYSGRVYPVNPTADMILGQKAFPDLLSVPDPIDLAIVAVPPEKVLGAIGQCEKKGIDSVIVITSGFKEIGGDGSRLEKELASEIKNAGIRLVGPNCLGVIDTASCLNASFAAGMPFAGHIGFFSQSGALCVAILDWALGENIGFSKFVSLGNKTDVTEIDLMKAMAADENTRVILGYLEGIEDGRTFMNVARSVSKKKPVILIKSGTTKAGAKAASSHTGALAGSNTAYNAAFKQCGIIHASSVHELFTYATAFASQPLPKGPNVAIITNSGGPGIIAADACDRSDLQLPSVPGDTVEQLRSFLPKTASFYNPIDIIGDAGAERYEKTLKAIIADHLFHSALILLTPTASVDIEETAKAIVSIAKTTDKPIMTSFMGEKRVRPGRRIFQENGIPSFGYPEDAVAALNAMFGRRHWLDQPEKRYERIDVATSKVRRIFASVTRQRRADLIEIEAREILDAYGFELPRTILANTTKEAVKAASEIGYPVVMKIASPDVLHKSDLGGTRVGLGNERMVEDAFFDITSNVRQRLPNARILGIVVQEMIQGGKEVILGITNDIQFGPMIMFGLGGIYVEVLKDVSFRIVPVSVEEADAMIREIRSFPLLRGVRGESPADLIAIRKSILLLSQMALDFPEIIEADINPLLIRPQGKGAIAVDARFTIQE
ncbi:MAG: acetate--CoA ligase family protein [Desulfobacterales bacterium]|nr:acetate--CoA ligase family protein [Desulfobacterales bacterium]